MGILVIISISVCCSIIFMIFLMVTAPHMDDNGGYLDKEGNVIDKDGKIIIKKEDRFKNL